MAEMKNISPHDVQNEAYSGSCAELIFLSKQCYNRVDCFEDSLRHANQTINSVPKSIRLLTQSFSAWLSPLSNVDPLPILHARPHEAPNPPTVQLHCQERSVHYSCSASQDAETHPRRTLFALQPYSVRNTEIFIRQMVRLSAPRTRLPRLRRTRR
jgi:hypothetical protein